MSTQKRERKKFKLPHLLVMMLMLLVLMSILTYIIPPSEYGLDPATGKINSADFHYLEARTPISIWKALLMIPKGLSSSGGILSMLFTMGGVTGVVMKSGAIDEMMDFTVSKLKNKGIDVLVPIITLVFLFFGAFAGGDYVVAMVPIGLMIARKLRVDPMVGFGTVMVASTFGMVSSPTNTIIPQAMMGVPIYSGFGVRFILMIPVFLIVILYVWRYARAVAGNPEKSILGKGEWYDKLACGDSEAALQEITFKPRPLLVTLLYFIQPVIVFAISKKLGLGMEVSTAVSLICAFAMGLICKMSLDEIGNAFAKGLAGMSFIGFIVGLSYAMSMVMNEGNIMPTIVHTLSLPLQSLNAGMAAIGISLVITAINVVIPSASAKAAILCPIIKPMCESLGVPLQIGVSAFKYGDTVTNLISPFSGALLGGLELCKITFDKYLKWVLPLCLFIMLYCEITLYFMGIFRWTGI